MDERDFYGDRPRNRALRTVLLLVAAFALGIGVSALAATRIRTLGDWISPQPAVQPQPAVAVRPQPVAVQPAPPADPAIAAQVGEMQSRLSEVEGKIDAATGDAARAEGLLLAFAARRALDRGQPLGFLEGMLRERFGGRDAASVAQVIAASQRPLTIAQLQEGLEALRPTLVTASPEESVWTGFKRELGSLFVLRHADAESQAPNDRYDRALDALHQGQVDVAAAEVARMPGAPGAADWLAQARRYVVARNALDRIETAALLSPRIAQPSSPAL